MSEFIEQIQGNGDVIFHKSKTVIRRDVYKGLRRLKLVFIFSFLLFFISPLFGLSVLFYSMVVFYKFIYLPLLTNRKLFEKYYSMFSPSVDATSLAIVGYKLEWSEVDEHIALVSGEDEKETQRKMAEKQAFMMLEKNRERWVGFGHKTITTHIVNGGASGSGKTEGIRSLLDASMIAGGGSGMNDGKSDEKMLVEIATQAKLNNRETSFMILNFLKGEKMAESNTLNPIAMMHPVRAVEFLGSLIKKGGGDATKEYFFNRGKVLLAAPINALSIRRDLLNEPFDFDRVMEFRNLKAFVVMQIMYYCMCRDLDIIIKENKILSARLKAHRSTFSDENLQHLHVLVDYVTQNPLERKIIEDELQISYRVIKETYSNIYLMMRNYLDGVWNQYLSALEHIGKTVYAMAKIDGKVFFSTNSKTSMLGFESFKKDYYEGLKNLLNSKGSEDQIKALTVKGRQFNLSVQDIVKSKEMLFRKKAEGGNIEDIPEDAVQQHQYASQQWDELSSIFTQYKHIFGPTKSEIEPTRLLLDNKLLYTLIPVLELSSSFVEILGKMTIMLIREVASVAIGGEIISVHKTIKNIMRDKFTPKPFTIEVLDEYNSYPIDDVDKLVLQLRSLNIGMVFGIQNFAGLKAGGDNETSQKNILGSSLKWLTRMEDDDAIEWSRKMIGEYSVMTNDYQIDAFDNVINGNTTKIDKKKAFDPELMRDFDNGFSIILGGSRKQKIIPMQSFYRGGKRETVHIKRFSPIEF